MPPAWRPPNQSPTNRPAQPPAYLANRFPVALNSPLCTLLAYTVKMIPNHMRLMHNSHSRHAFRETTTGRFEPPDYICRDCGGESITACSLFEGRSLAAESSIRRYRFGSCQGKQQTTRDECGEAWLDTEPSEMVRSRLGTVA